MPHFLPGSEPDSRLISRAFYMEFSLIPPWNQQGVIPPINQSSPTSPIRAPYPTDVSQLVERFSTSIERCRILAGFLSHRAEMHRMGISAGTQWLDGSFMENVEMLEGRPPNDLDVATFADIPLAVEQALTPLDQQMLTDNQWIKATYGLDFYFTQLSNAPENLIETAAYWYSLWSHKRSLQWKGFLSVKLDPSHDQQASDLLAVRKQELHNGQN